MVTDTGSAAPRWILTALVAVEIAAVAGLGVRGRADAARLHREQTVAATLTGELRLTGLAFGSESGFTRQPALAVPGDALSTHPAALDTFPSGSVIPPPAHIVRVPGPAPSEAP